MWQYGQCSAVIGGGIKYVTQDGHSVGINDLRCIWQMLNQDIPLESTIKDAVITKSATTADIK